MKSTIRLLIGWIIIILITQTTYVLPRRDSDFEELVIAFNSKRMDIKPFDSYIIRNDGQVENDECKYYSRNGNIFFTENSITFVYREREKISDPIEQNIHIFNNVQSIENRVVLKYTFINPNNVIPTGMDTCSWVCNFFYGNDPDRWRTGVPCYLGVEYKNIWDGIDILFKLTNNAIKYDIIVHPYANQNQIKIHIEGQDSIINKEKDLLIKAGPYQIVDHIPMVYYQDDGSEIQCNFKLYGTNIYGFDLEKYVTDRTVVIDPLIYSTYLGGSGDDGGWGVDLDKDNNAVIAGHVFSVDFPTTTGVFQQTLKGYVDIFLCKLNNDGSGLIFSTFIGGSKQDGIQQKVLVLDDGIILSGATNSSDYPVTNDAYQSHIQGMADIFYTKLNKDASSIIYSTYIGGSKDDWTRSFIVNDDHIILTGPTNSSDFPITSNALYDTHQGGRYYDAFLIIMSNNGRELYYSTYFGGSSYDVSCSVVLDSKGNICLAGYTQSEDFPVTQGAFDETFNGRGPNIFVSKIKSDLSCILASTFLGGGTSPSEDRNPLNRIINDIAIDQDDDIYITGITRSMDFPVTNGAYDTSYNGGLMDAFVTKMNKDLDYLEYSTYLGGTTYDGCYHILVDEEKCAYVVGASDSSDFPRYNSNGPTNPNKGKYDMVLAKINQNGSNLTYSNLFGGSDIDSALYFAMDKYGNFYITGYTYSSDFPVTENAFDTQFNQGLGDAFLTKISRLDGPVADAGSYVGLKEDTVVTLDASKSHDAFPIINYTWTIHDRSGDITLYRKYAYHIFEDPGVYIVELLIRSEDGAYAADVVTLYVMDITPPIADAGPDLTVYEDDLVRLSAGNSSDNYMIVSYNWSFTNGLNNVTLYGIEIMYLFEHPGVYVINLTVTDEAGNRGYDSVKVSVLDRTRPKADAGPDQYVDQGSWIIFDGSNSTDNVGIVNYTWTFIDWDPIGLYGVDPSYKFDDPGIFLVTLNITDSHNNHDEDDLTVFVRDTTPPKAEILGTNRVQVGDEIIFNGTRSRDNVCVTNYTWEIMDGTMTILEYGSMVSYTFKNIGFFTISLTVFDIEGNSDTTHFMVSAIDTRKPFARASGDRSVDEDEPIIFDGTRSEDNGIIENYTWTIYDRSLVIGYGEMFIHTFDESGEFDVTLKVIDQAGNWDEDTITIKVIDITEPIAHADVIKSVHQFELFLLDGSNSRDNVGVINWTWTIAGADAIYLYFGEYVNVSLSASGSYQITLNVKDEAGNIGKDIKNITVLSNKYPYCFAGEDMTIRSGSLIYFDGSLCKDEIGIDNWTWTIKGWTVSGSSSFQLYGKNTSYIFKEPGVYRVTLVVINQEGLSSEDDFHLVVNDDDNNEIGAYQRLFISAIMVLLILLTIMFVLFIRERRSNKTMKDDE